MKYLVVAVLLTIFSSCKQKAKQPKLLLTEFAFSDNHWSEKADSNRFCPDEYIDIDSTGTCRIMVHRIYNMYFVNEKDSVGYFKVKADSAMINKLNKMFYNCIYPEGVSFSRSCLVNSPQPEIDDRIHYTIVYSSPKAGKFLTTFPADLAQNRINRWVTNKKDNPENMNRWLLKMQLLKTQLEIIIANAKAKDKTKPFDISRHTNYVQQYFEDRHWLPPPPPEVKLTPPISLVRKKNHL